MPKYDETTGSEEQGSVIRVGRGRWDGERYGHADNVTDRRGEEEKRKRERGLRRT